MRNFSGTYLEIRLDSVRSGNQQQSRKSNTKNSQTTQPIRTQNNFTKKVVYKPLIRANSKSKNIFRKQVLPKFFPQFYNKIKVKQENQMRDNKVSNSRIAPQHSQGKIKFGEFSQLDINVPEASYQDKQPVSRVQNPSFCARMATNKKAIICVMVTFVVLSAATVGIVVGLLNMTKATPTSDQNFVAPGPPQTVTSCADVPDECAGVPVGVSDYIFNSYTNDDQIRSLLQVSRTLGGFSANSTAQELVSSFREILRSAECMSYTLSDSYGTAYQNLISLQMADPAAVLAYLTMNQAFSGEPVRLTPPEELINNCQFNVTTPSARRRLQSSQNCSADATAVLVYFDGVGSSPSSTIQNLRQIENTLHGHSEINFDGGSVALGAFRNPSSSNYFEDVVSGYQQHQRQNGETEHDSYDLYRSLQLILDSNTQHSRLPITVEEYQRFNNYLRTTTIQSFLNNQAEYNLNRHKEFIQQQIREGKKVVFVAHGEATIYANIIYNLLTPTQKQSVSEVFIAPFANQMADNSGNYVSHENDHALSEVRRESSSSNRYPAPLNNNQNSRNFDRKEDDGDNHDIRGYLQTFKSKIINLITQARLRVVQPPRQLGSGPITVALSWDSQPDLDLHIFEPNFHVYYVQRSGLNGYLDLDDVNGYGPEHYYTNCTIETGDYTFKVNYYYGMAPSSATVTVSAGTEYFSKQLTLQTARGSGGNANPQYSICTVTVSRSPLTNSYLFSITPL